MILLALLLWMWQTPSASLEGVVVRAGSNEPVTNARVILTNANILPLEALASRDPVPSVRTSGDGRFAFKNVQPGSYRLLLEANGYVRQEYGQRTFPGNGTLIRITEGESRKDLVVGMTPTGTVMGRILDESGRPLVAVQVRLLRHTYSPEGYRTLRQFAVAQTDERGEYRLFYVTPGRYYLNAGTAQGPGGYPQDTTGPNELRLAYSYRFYPGVADLSAATLIDVASGSTRSAIDLTLMRQPLYRVRGQVIDGSTGRPPEKPELLLHFLDTGTGRDYSLAAGDGAKSLTYRDGVFEFTDIVPGAYYLSASEVTRVPPSRQFRRVGITPVQVGASDVDGIVVTIPPGFSVPGRVRIEGAASPNLILGTRPVVSLHRDANGSAASTILNVSAEVAADGTFRVEGATRGPYRVTMSFIDSRFSIKEARFGGVDVFNPAFEFTGQEGQNLEIVLSSNIAAVDGIVTNSRGEPAATADVILVPERNREHTELFKSATTDQNGRFTISSVAPGDYRAFAWDGIEPYSWFDPEVVKRDEQAGRSVHLAESSRINLDLRLIPPR